MDYPLWDVLLPGIIASSKLSWAGFGALVLNLVPMAVMRHVLRDWSLGLVDYHPGALPVKLQWGPFIIFALGLVLALALVLWGDWRAHVETKEVSHA